MTAAMRPGRFARLLDGRGEDPAAWTEAERAAAEALLAASPEARHRLRQAQRLRRAVQAALPQPAPAAVARLRRHVAARIAREPAPQPAMAAAGSPGLLAQFGLGALGAVIAATAWLVLTPTAPALPGAAAASADPLALLLQPAAAFAEDPL